MVVEQVRSRILDGTYRLGESLPSETDLAGIFQVGRGSVRTAIEALVESGDLQKIRHSRPIVARPHKQSAASEKTDIHVWVAATIRDDTAVPFLQGVSRELAGTPYRMVVHEPSFFVENIVQADERKFLLNLTRRPNVAGAIIWRDVYAEDSDAIAMVQAHGVPMVFVDSMAPDGLQTDHVGTANIAAAKRCVKHLLDQGHRRIVCVSDTDIPRPLTERVKGYWSAMRQAGLGMAGQSGLFGQYVLSAARDGEGIGVDPLGGVYARSLDRDSFYSGLAHNVVEQILQIDPLPTALFVTYDVLAYWIWAVLEGRNIRVPQQMSIVGFDWRAQWDRSLADELDTAAQDFEGFGHHSVALLLDRINGEAPPNPRHVLLDAPLVKRSSTHPIHFARPGLSLSAPVQNNEV